MSNRLSAAPTLSPTVQAAALDAFVAFTEAVGAETDVLALAEQAIAVLSVRFPDCSGGFYRLEDNLWKLRVHTDDLSARPDFLQTLQAGLPFDLPLFAGAFRQRQPQFTDAWDPVREQVEDSGDYRTVCAYPVVQGGAVHAMLVLGLKTQSHWEERDRAIVRSVGRGLTLALERTAQAHALKEKNSELEGRTRALEAFADLTTQLSTEADPYTLIRRAQATLMALLPPGYAAFWEIRGERWIATMRVNEVGSADLQAVIDQGLPLGHTPTLDRPFQTREPYFESVYSQGADTAAHVVSHIHAVGCVPVLVGGEVVGILNVPLFETRSWDAADRAILTTAARSLGLALERVDSLRQLQERSADLERTNTQLQESNEALEAFGYSVSHDLRTPVRHIQSFAELARRALSQDKPEKAAQHLTVIEGAATRMHALIEAMLRHSRSAQQPLVPVAVDLNELLAVARADAEQDLEGRRVEWTVDRLPTVQGDPYLLQQVLTNLTVNAVKFTRGRDPARIAVRAREEGREWWIEVEDDGAGFDPAQVEILFGAFKRLHRADEFEGTGVGLATVKRIVTRHGGRVAASSRPGEGAVFSFSLPKEALPAGEAALAAQGAPTTPA